MSDRCARCGENPHLPGITKCLDCVNEMLPGGSDDTTETGGTSE